MVKTLFLVRHGATGKEDKKRYKGSIDVPLSKEGEMQMSLTSDVIKRKIKDINDEQKVGYLRDIHGEAFEDNNGLFLYSSSLIRAVKSAQIIGEGLGVVNTVIQEFRERNFGVWEGLTFDEIKSMYPVEFENWRKNPLRFSPPDGESTLDIKKRVIPALKKILKRHKSGNIIIIAHGGVNRVIICYLLGMSLKNVFRIEQGYGCINIIEFWNDSPVVKSLNLTI